MKQQGGPSPAGEEPGPGGHDDGTTRGRPSLPAEGGFWSRLRGHPLVKTLPYARPYRAMAVMAVITSIFALGAATAVPMIIKGVIDGPLSSGDRAGILLPALGIIGLGILESVLQWSRRRLIGELAFRIETDVRNDVYACLQRLEIAFHDRWQSGQLLSRAMSDSRLLRRFYGFGIIFLFITIATFAVVFTLMLRLNVLLALVTAISVVPVIWLSRRFEHEYLAASRRVQDEEGNLTTLVEESALGLRVLKAYGRRRLAAARYLEQARKLYSCNMTQVRLRARFWSLLQTVPNLTLGLILLGGGLAVGTGTLTLGGLVAFISLLTLLVWPVEMLGEILALAEEASAGAQRILEVIDRVPAVADRARAADLVLPTGLVRFENVSFGYGGGEEILTGADLEIRPGETLALVGATGSGKTTLCALVPRLYDVTGGRITIDGRDIRDLTLASLRRHVGVAFEDPILFSASVRENVALGFPDATDDDVAAALEVAQAGFIYDLPWGLDTRIGEQGMTLSGGQRQRLALARAILGQPRILVMDDPLSAIDVETEAQIEQALVGVLRDVTALIVVHRPSTVALADRVAFLQDGKIAAVGTHSELLATTPAYRDVLSKEAEELSA